MTDTFNPPVNADSASTKDVAVNGISSKFADGYGQFTPYGLNAILDTPMPKWTNLYEAEAFAIINFFKEQNGAAFYYIPNGSIQRSSFRCLKWTETWKHGRRCDISATFEPAAPNS